MEIIKNFINEEDVKIIQEYIKTIKFNTKEDHVPLHDNLYSEDGTKFDIHTRGEMPDYILNIFSKYSKGIYEFVNSKFLNEYHPPMFSKHYIARYRTGACSEPHFNPDKPKGTYGSYIVWQNANLGGEILFPNRNLSFISNPGDLIIFEETKEDIHGINQVLDGNLFISEAWLGKKGQLWMANSLPYEQVYWDDWEIKGFYE